MEINSLAVRRGYLNYRLDGPDHLPLIVFSNSLGTDARIWSAVTSLLSNQYRFLLYDKRGHGLSTCQGGDRLEEHVDDLIQLLDGLGLQQVYLCGLSVGGMIAQGVASKRSDLVKALILCATGHRIGTPTIWNERVEAIRSGGMEAVSESVLERWFTPEFRQQHQPQYALWKSMLIRTPLQGYISTCAAIRDADYTKICRTLTVPTLCVAGDSDEATPPELVRALADLIPDTRFEIISGAGHMPGIEQPAALALLIDKFISNHGKDKCRFERGMHVRRSVLGAVHVDRAEANKTPFDEPFQTFITESAWGSVWSRPGLSKRDRSLLTIAMVAVLGHDDELAMHIRATENTGASMVEVRETLLQVAIYGGAPASNNAMRIAKKAYAEMAQSSQ
jgi:3-oxoadipate enol-lactonase/4-carboxymuconolactone decarboxylase